MLPLTIRQTHVEFKVKPEVLEGIMELCPICWGAPKQVSIYKRPVEEPTHRGSCIYVNGKRKGEY